MKGRAYVLDPVQVTLRAIIHPCDCHFQTCECDWVMDSGVRCHRNIWLFGGKVVIIGDKNGNIKNLEVATGTTLSQAAQSECVTF